MRNFSRFFLILFVFSTFSGSLFAQDTMQHTAKEVVIKVTRAAQLSSSVPASVSVIDKKEIQLMQATISLEESLRKVPGVFINNRYNFSQGERISIRGMGSRAQFGVRNIKVLLDGIPLTFADGQTQLNNLELSNIGRIEILRGPGSFLYGNAAAGIIYMTSELADSSALTFTPRITFGSFGLQKYQAKLSGSKGKFNYLINGSRTDFEGFRQFSSANFYNLNSNIQYNINDSNKLTFILNLMDAPYMFNPGTLTKEEARNTPETVRTAVQKQAAGKEIKQGQSGINYNAKFKNHQHIDASIYGVLRNLYNPIFGRIIDVKREAAGFRSLYEKKFFIAQSVLSWSTGIDAEYQQDARQEWQNAGVSETQLRNIPKQNLIDSAKKGDLLVRQNEAILGSGAFTQIKLDFLKNFTFSSALRYDYFVFSFKNKLAPGNEKETINFDQFSPSFGAVYRFNKIHAQLYTNFSTAFQTPTANEFSNTPAGGGGFNASLRPETTKSIEVGARLKKEKISVEIATFYFTVANQLIAYQHSTASDEVFYRNAGKTQNTGVETSVKLLVLKGLNLSANYTFMHFIFSDYILQQNADLIQLKGNKVPGVPAHKLFTGLNYQHIKSGLMAEINFQWISSYFANDLNGYLNASSDANEQFRNDAYMLTDLRLGYKRQDGKKWQGLQFFAGINNLFDIKYNASIMPNAAANRFFEPGPGRNFYAGMEIPFVLIK